MDSLPRCSIIVNPNAGRGQAGRKVSAVRGLLGRYGADVRWLFTTAPGDAEAMARKAVEDGDKLVIAMGGDGTIHEVANGVLGAKDVVVGLIPFGTGNDLARALGLFGNVEIACGALLDGVCRTVDVGELEGQGTGGKRHFLAVAGAGFDAHTARTVNSGVRFLSGAPAYVYGAVATLIGFQPFDITLTIDTGEVIRTPAMFATIANSSTTGGGMKIAPDADVSDGLFDICLVSAVPKLTLLHQLTKVFDGAHVNHPAVRIVRTSSVTIEADPPQPLLIDGEVLGTTPVTARVLPGALRVMAPRDGALGHA
jgi:diacylglycerol kinase (ATP)